MNKIILTFLLLSITFACSTTKSLNKKHYTESENTDLSINSSLLVESLQYKLNEQIISLDLSTIHIKSYFPFKDSSGNQLVEKEVIIYKNEKIISDINIDTSSRSEKYQDSVKVTSNLISDYETVHEVKEYASIKKYILESLLILIPLGFLLFLFIRRYLKIL
ncbi:MAG: hypothetical protein Q8S23_08190 [Bacteroidales bacterium]|nr:hypothetical protein [Bacteroidales bacterium]